MFGSISAVSGPTVISPLLRAVNPSARLGHILRWECILVDPIGALLAILVFTFIVSMHNSDALNILLWHFFKTILTGAVIGGAFASLIAVLINRNLVPDYLQNITTLGLVISAFALADYTSYGAAYLRLPLWESL